MKNEDSDRTFISPKFVQTAEGKLISEWIISVGNHEGFIPSDQKIEIQELWEAISEKYNRPYHKINTLLAVLIHYPICIKRLNAISEIPPG